MKLISGGIIGNYNCIGDLFQTKTGCLLSFSVRSITKDATKKALTALGATLNFIYIWLKLFIDNYSARCDAYINAIKEMFKQIPETMKKSLIPKQKIQKLMIDIGGGWYM